MPEHKLKTPEDCNCNGERHCMICDGGLAVCKVCNGAEAALPTECPGRKMTSGEMDKVQSGDLDYCNGEWVAGPQPCEGCFSNWADPPSKLCPGCEAYRDHQC